MDGEGGGGAGVGGKGDLAGFVLSIAEGLIIEETVGKGEGVCEVCGAAVDGVPVIAGDRFGLGTNEDDEAVRAGGLPGFCLGEGVGAGVRRDGIGLVED